MPGVRLGVEERETIALGLVRGEYFSDIAPRMQRPRAMQESCVSPKHEPRETCCFECFDPDHGEISCLQCRFRA